MLSQQQLDFLFWILLTQNCCEDCRILMFSIIVGGLTMLIYYCCCDGVQKVSEDSVAT